MLANENVRPDKETNGDPKEDDEERTVPHGQLKQLSSHLTGFQAAFKLLSSCFQAAFKLREL